MKKVLRIVCFFLIGLAAIKAQTPHQVINSAGQDRVSPSLSLTLTDNVGEVLVQTVSDGTTTITQGFLQDFNLIPGVSVTVFTNNVTCLGKKDGRLSVSLTNSMPNYTISYLWSDTTLCPTKNCNVVDSLGPDTLFLTVIVVQPAFGGGTKVDSIVTGPHIITDVNPPCNITVFNGITANNDGANDFFYIENIEQYPNNRVSIYNRWGNKLYDVNNYNNVDIRWPEESDLRTLTSGTYFYVLELGDNASTIKGWIELLKN